MKATMYSHGEFTTCPSAHRITLVEHGRMDYAQYKSVPFVRYIPKGKRTTYELCKGFRPFILIVEGWDAPEAPDMMVRIDECSEQSKYLSHDEQYLRDFNNFINPLIANGSVKVIVDYRSEVV